MHITSNNLSVEEILHLMHDKRTQSPIIENLCICIEVMIENNRQAEASYQRQLDEYLNLLKGKSVCPVCEAKIAPTIEGKEINEYEKPTILAS